MPDLRYKRLGYTAVDVTNLERAVTFHEKSVGLEVNTAASGRAGSPTLLRGSAVQCELALYEAEEPGLRRVAFEMENEAYLRRARDHIASLGLRVWDVADEEASLFAQRSAIRFPEPNTGLTIELYVGDGSVAPPVASTDRLTNITQIGHVVVHTVDPLPVTDFFAQELNFRISDYIDKAAFMRCFPNPYHHSLGITRADENRLNHVSFLVESLDDVGRAVYRLQQQDVEIVFGPGRHPPSGSVFLYFLDPDGMTFELSTGMEEFPEVGAREPRRLPMVPESYDYWGSPRRPMMGKRGLVRPEKLISATLPDRVVRA